MKYPAINGWTKDGIMRRIRERVPEEGCMSPEGLCVYRLRLDEETPDRHGPACVAGAFIPDTEPVEVLFSSQAIAPLLRDAPYLLEHMPLDVEAMSALQVRHDGGGLNDVPARDRCLAWVEEHVYDEPKETTP